MKIGDKVVIVDVDLKRHECLKYAVKRVKIEGNGKSRTKVVPINASKLKGLKGRIVMVLVNSFGLEQGAKIRFPGGWSWSFYSDEFERR